jgi:hypothetical protein
VVMVGDAVRPQLRWWMPGCFCDDGGGDTRSWTLKSLNLVLASSRK